MLSDLNMKLMCCAPAPIQLLDVAVVRNWFFEEMEVLMTIDAWLLLIRNASGGETLPPPFSRGKNEGKR